MLAVMTMCGKIPARSKVRNLFDLFDEDLDGKLNSAETVMLLRCGSRASNRAHPQHKAPKTTILVRLVQPSTAASMHRRCRTPLGMPCGAGSYAESALVMCRLLYVGTHVALLKMLC